jgi:acyl transferase domain-containing protein/acyl carrier protein
MEPILKDFAQVTREITFFSPQIPLISNVSGQLATGDLATSEYWCQHIRQPVRFAAGIETLLEQGYEVFLEIGTKPILSSLGRQIQSSINNQQSLILWLPSLRQGRSDWQQLLHSLGELYVHGMHVDWAGFDRDYPRRRVTLPTYPFQRQRYWVETSEVSSRKTAELIEVNSRSEDIHPLIGRRIFSATLQDGEILFESHISQKSPTFLRHHQVFQHVIPPIAVYVEIALAAGSVVFKSGNLGLEEFVIQQALILPENQTKTLQIVLTSDRTSDEKTEKYFFQIFSLTMNEKDEQISWMFHASGKIFAENKDALPPQIDMDALQARCTKEIPIETFYQGFHERGINYGDSFREIKQLRMGKGEVLGLIQVPKTFMFEVEDYKLYPPQLDAAMQVFGTAFLEINKQDCYLPVGIERLRFYKHPESQVWSYTQISPVKDTDQQTLTTKELRLFNPEGHLIAAIEGVVLKKANLKAMLRSSREPWQDWLYTVEWLPRMRKGEQSIDESIQEKPELKPGNWLILTDTQGVGQQLATHLSEREKTCTLVFSGKEYEQVAEHEFRIDPVNLSDFQRLLKQTLTAQSPSLDGVVYLWGLDSAKTSELTITDLKEVSQRECGSILYLIRSLINVSFAEPPSLWLVTRGTQPVGDMPHISGIAQSPLWGMGKVIGLEYPEIWGGMLDLSPDVHEGETVALLTEILDSEGEDHLAFRNGQRYVARLMRGKQLKFQDARFQTEGTYLITGGLGALGLKVAQCMVDYGARYLVLNGRRGVSSNTQQEVINYLEQAGAMVLVAKADVSKEEDMIKVLTEIKTSMPPLKGIVHAAGVAGYQLIKEMDVNTIESVFRPKVIGTWILHQLTKEMDLDFFVCFSSIASLFGSPGQGNYAAANAFLDALAHYRRHLKLPALSINWGLWANGGMASPDFQKWLTQMGVGTLPPEQAIDVLCSLIGTNCIQTTVAKMNWDIFKELYEASKKRPLLETITGRSQEVTKQSSEQQSEILQRLFKTSEHEHYSLLLEYIQDLAVEILGLNVSQFDIHQSLNTMGLDSLMAFELRNRIKTDLGVEVPLVKFLEDLNVEGLILEIKQQLKEVAFTSAEFVAVGISPIQEKQQADQIDMGEGISLEQAGQLLRNPDQLTDKQVDELLRGMLSKKEK